MIPYQHDRHCLRLSIQRRELNANDAPFVAWGLNPYNQTNVPVTLTNVTAIAAGAYCTSWR